MVLQANSGFLFQQERFHAGAAAFFGAFQQELYVGGQLPAGLQVGFAGTDEGVQLAFIIVGAAGVDIAVLDERLERVGKPGFQGFGGNDIVMAVEQQGGFIRSGMQPLAVYNRVGGCGDDLDRLYPNAGELIGQPFGSLLDFGLVGEVGADAGDADQLAGILQEEFPVILGITKRFLKHEKDSLINLNKIYCSRSPV